MTEPSKLDLVLLWHMHQPDFRDQDSGEFRQPWVYLHALKDYTDMAAHLEAHPGVRAVVNLVPVLLDQLEDYARAVRQRTAARSAAAAAGAARTSIASTRAERELRCWISASAPTTPR